MAKIDCEILPKDFEAPKLDQRTKLVMIGDEDVGKSCILERMKNDRFEANLEKNLGAQFGNQKMKVQDQIVSLNVFDTSGGLEYRGVSAQI